MSKDQAVVPKIKFSKLHDKDDVSIFLQAFENLAANKIDKSAWAGHIAPQLTGKAHRAYGELKSADLYDYEVLKTAILAKYELTAETYRVKFQSLRRVGP